MPVTNQIAIRFCNERVRVASDQLQRSHYLADAAKDRWDALGGGAAALTVMHDDIRKAADAVLAVYPHCMFTERIWFLGVDALFPNDATTVDDGSPADGRPAATGSKVHSLMTRIVEFQNWLRSALQSFTDPLRNNTGTLDTIIEASSSGRKTMTLTQAQNMITRCSELRTNYKATSNANLNTLLALLDRR